MRLKVAVEPDTLENRKKIALALRLLSPGYGTCLRCGMPWSFTDGHDTRYSKSGACFPLCESCWQELTPETRLPYYRKMYEEWSQQIPPIITDKWRDIERAVKAGK